MNELYRRLPGPHKVLIGVISAATLVIMMTPSHQAGASRSRANPETVSASVSADNSRYSVDLGVPELLVDHSRIPQAPMVDERPEAAPQLVWQDVKVVNGDSLSRVFQRAGFTRNELQSVLNLGDKADALTKLRPGDVLRFGTDDSGNLAALSFSLDPLTTLNLTRTDSGFDVNTEQRHYDVEIQIANATIQSSFYNAGVDAGLSPAQIMNLATIFGWDIDFALDLRKGDHFSVLFEKRYLDGSEAGTGNILAAEFVNQGEIFRAVYNDADGSYYTPEGKAMRKAFLRAPVDFKYVSSEFNPRRLHPVTGLVRPHRGIDYVAAVGTPVMSAGSGTVVESGYTSLNGNYVVIRHNATYTTKYLHLNKRFVQKGQRVAQAQKIGTVGATGRVTGAHLHYEFIIDGVHRNPRTVKLPDAESLTGTEREAFVAKASNLLAQLEGRNSSMVAMSVTADSASGATN